MPTVTTGTTLLSPTQPSSPDPQLTSLSRITITSTSCQHKLSCASKQICVVGHLSFPRKHSFFSVNIPLFVLFIQRGSEKGILEVRYVLIPLFYHCFVTCFAWEKRRNTEREEGRARCVCQQHHVASVARSSFSPLHAHCTFTPYVTLLPRKFTPKEGANHINSAIFCTFPRTLKRFQGQSGKTDINSTLHER